MKNQTTVFCFILTLILPLSCQMKMSQQVNERVVIVYMIADNNLEHFAWQDINEMEEGLLPGQRLLAYVDGGSNSEPAHPVLFEIIPDKSEHIVSRIVRVWPEQDSAAPQVIGQILGSIREDFPAREYGLVFWSHGSAWLPAGYSIDLSDKDDQGIEEPPTNIRSHYNVQETKSFGLDEGLENNRDGSSELDITRFAEALPGSFAFIAFDVCYMASIEVAAELSHKTDYILASPAEVLAYGFPYDRITPELFNANTSPSLMQAAEEYWQSYEKRSGRLQSATISLINTRELANVAGKLAPLISQLQQLNDELLAGVQQYEREGNGLFYDLMDLIVTAQEQGLIDNADVIALEQALADLLPFTRSTDTFLDLSLDGAHGLSIYLPTDEDTDLEEYYRGLAWSRLLQNR